MSKSLPSIHAENFEDDLFDYYYNQPGTMPGTLTIDSTAQSVEIVLINYDSHQANRLTNLSLEDCLPYIENSSVAWMDVLGLGDEELLRKLGEILHLDRLALEDIVNVPQRPKVEENLQYLLIITQMVIPKEKGKGFWQEQVSLVLGKDYVVTVQEEPQRDCFNLVRDRIRHNKGIIRQRGADYLTYALWDAIIDTFFVVLETYRERIEDLEEEVAFKATHKTLNKIYKMKRELLALRRAIWPQREALNSIIKERFSLISEEVRRDFRDCYDHAVQIIDLIEVYNELLGELMNVYMSSYANKTNEVMKILTVISTIFIPLTFIAGIYGMNFDTEKSPWNMPELEWYWGYPACLSVMLFIAVSLIIFFWRRGWFKDMTKVKQPNS
ncbi:magnesium and cobalt transport protein CorA [Gloeothece citriformis PCC 7424]|uniref:Magnesium transport protein CorA n=1 Tax=Gloeothece citriformis (strain PCC 7424) TaxID=65393 RepID=B7KDD4_GLOC7|nr:magnesium/cobalt transporter CorA [Gloeothece citriformis]ACK68954.1 magnesium and cobalt transport protein CorA [Gloeothece citriformis PCC 7424]